MKRIRDHRGGSSIEVMCRCDLRFAQGKAESKAESGGVHILCSGLYMYK